MANRGSMENTNQPAHPRVFELSHDAKWGPASGIGLGSAFGVELAERDSAIVVGLIPCAVARSSIENWEPNGVHEPTGVRPYDEAVRRTHRALRDGRLSAILWHQGESDSNADSSEGYEEQLHGLVDRFRAEFKDPQLPFIVGQMGRFQDYTWHQAQTWVDAAHRKLPQRLKWTAFVPSHDLSHKGDGVHFDTTSLEKLGQRYAMSYFPLRNAIEAVRPLPPIPRTIPVAGLSMPPERQTRLERRLVEEQSFLDDYRNHPHYADAAIFLKAVQWALFHNEFYHPTDFDLAEEMIDLGRERRKHLAEQKTPWRPTINSKGPRGMVVRGFVSQIDGSPQPYGLEIAEGLNLSEPIPLIVWLHPREKNRMTDLRFIDQRRRDSGLSQDNALVLHPFGRQSLGYKSAGETDVLEAIEAVARDYPIDRNRIALMGFSMGGAGAWHLGAHYADRWAVVHPGGGWSETPRYHRLRPEDYPPPYEQTLWGLYDATPYARNYLHLPVIAYSGEEDPLKIGADVMAETLMSYGLEMRHLIGSGVGHRYDEASIIEIDEFVQRHLQTGRDVWPQKISFQTRTLRYSRHHWIEILGLKSHWEDTRVDGDWNRGHIRLTTCNVTTLLIHAEPDSGRSAESLTLDGQRITVPDGRKAYYFERSSDNAARWELFDGTQWPGDSLLRKRPGLQGPIDDAFQGAFMVVLPDQDPPWDTLRRWLDFETTHLQSRWRSLFRGELRIKRASEVTSADVEDYHLVLWGEPGGNRWIRELISASPLGWEGANWIVNGHTYPASTHVPALIYPSPWSGNRYVVLNSGPTFRESHDWGISLQSPKLPDWAVLDMSQPPNGVSAGAVEAAGFFDERWQFR